jgi:hypothetical protein
MAEIRSHHRVWRPFLNWRRSVRCASYVFLPMTKSVQILLYLVFSDLVAQQIHLLLMLEIPYLFPLARRVLLALDSVELLFPLDPLDLLVVLEPV